MLNQWIVLANFAGAAFVAGAWWIAWMNRNVLPPKIPIHFGFTGAPNRWGPRAMIWTLPVVTLVVFILYLAVPLAHASAGIRSMMALLRVEVTGLMYYCTRGQIRIALGRDQRLGPLVWLWTVAILATVFYFTACMPTH
ncbi:MAG TPA: DUF1648 domain-containing protein [Armatimonadota bacterium]|nr:DUF1648 domain-containing protein [Armatimonadota bacterium]